jgi:DNA-cytosine methyltransferase
VDTTETITHLSLCSGYEGIGLGLRRVLPNLREIAYVEREGFPVANLVAKMEAGDLDAAPVFTDVKTFPYTRFRHKVDILSGGFPCQPFSAAGKRKATEDPRHLFPFIANGIRDCKPRIIFLENVEGIISAKTADGESVLKYVLGELEGLGYRATAGIFSASEVGAPHQRKRVFILGVADTEGSQSRLTTERKGRQDSSGGSEEELADSKDIGRRGWTHRDGDDGARLQEQEAQEQSNLWGEAPGCSRDSRGELADCNYEGLEGFQCHSSSEQSEPIEADPWSEGSTRWPSRPGEQGIGREQRVEPTRDRPRTCRHRPKQWAS